MRNFSGLPTPLLTFAQFVGLGILVHVGLICPSYGQDSIDIAESYEINLARGVLDEFPESAEAHRNLGLSFGRAGFYAEAIDSFEKALTIQPTRLDMYHVLATLSTRIDEEEDAIRFLKQAIARFPEAPSLHMRLGLVLLHTGELDEAYDAFSVEAGRAPREPLLFFYRGEIRRLQREHEEARSLLESAIELNPAAPEPYYSLAQVEMRLGNRERAMDLMQQFEERKTGARSVIEHPDDNDEQRVIRSKASAHRDAGRVYLINQRFEEAEEHFRKAIAIDPGEIACRAQLVDMLLRHTKEPEEALAVAMELTDLSPQASHFNLLGWAFLENKMMNESLDAFRNAVRLDPTNATYKQRLERLQQVMNQGGPR